MPVENPKTIRILSDNLFPVVGIGASAGGLDAFKEFVRAIPEQSGMAYIIVQHLATQHESILSDILQKATKIPVVKIKDHVKVTPDHIYVIPSNNILTANDGVLLLNPLPKTKKLNAVDTFFISLAEIHLEHAIGIIFSGTGTDGTVGLKTIKDQGGITIVQDKHSAAYYGMPQSAIDAEVVDYVLSPKEIPGHLQKLVETAAITVSGATISEDVQDDEIFRDILDLLRSKRGVDFTFYKQTTILRRTLRRIGLNKNENLKDYQQYLLHNEMEQDALFNDLLIPVTAFFRDPETFSFLYDKVFPVLFKDKESTDTVRIWIAGCSTGEEAYSMAICLHEYFAEVKISRKIQIFATDVSDTVIAKARMGMYKKKDMTGVSDERIKQFFTKTDGSYQVNKKIREYCVFAIQNFLKDPPFAKIDMLSCRNVLIYMEPYLQKKAMSTFHYSLNANGFLLLGKSETVNQSTELFHTFSRFEKIFTKKVFSGRYMHVANDNNEEVIKRKDARAKNPEVRKDDFQKAADEAILAKYAAVGVVVNEQLNVLQFRGSTGAYLEAPPGKLSYNVLKMAREGLSFELRSALHKARESNEPFIKQGISLENGKHRVTIEVIPLKHTIETYFLILFSTTPEEMAVKNKAKRKLNAEEEGKLQRELLRIEALEQELAQAHRDMRDITQDQDAANEELQSANEDLLAGSEELQSLNEELETTKEEIQSSNEELIILNQELLERNEQLSYARKYAEAIISTIHEPLIILTKDLRVRSANKAFYEKFRLTQQQTEDKFFFEMEDRKWNIPGLSEKLNKILPDQSYFEGFEVTRSIPTNSEGIIMLNARQLINDHSNEQLILLAMHDITERKTLEKNQQLFAHELELQVVERTKELKEANTNLEYTNENLQQFAYIAAHDLQEPLRKIKTFTTILDKKFFTELSDEGKGVINKIRVSANRMSQLIKEVLEYSKVTYAPKDFIQTNLDVIIRSVINDLDLLVSETGTEIKYHNNLPVIDAIPLQINQLFYNLLTNAIKFRKEIVSPVITITYKLLSGTDLKKISHLNENFSYIQLVFSDNGIGFEQQFADQIFHLFERLHPIDDFEGTGVGLALCKKIVENHHGQIFATSQDNEGAVFYVILPVKQ